MKSRKTSLNRKLSIYGFEMVHNGHNFFALLDFDICNVRSILREKRKIGKGGSLFAFFLKSIALCISEFPQFNSMINHKKTSEFDSVDISVPVELIRNGEIDNIQYLIKNACGKSIGEIDQEIYNSKNTETEQSGYILSKTTRKFFSLLPKWLVVFIMKSYLKNHKKVMKLSGSTFVTSISMFSNIPGYIIPYAGGPKACSFAIGSVIKKPVVVDDEIQIREMVSMTCAFNHDIIDGAPAARFINRLREIIEKEYLRVIEG